MFSRLSVISVFILSTVPLSRLEKSSSRFAFPFAALKKSVSGLISFIKEHELLLKAQEEANSGPYSALVMLLWS